MAAKFPIEYAMSPQSLRAGSTWLTVRLKNVSDEPLSGLHVRLNSVDTYAIEVQDPSQHVSSLGPDEEIELSFQLRTKQSGGLYISVDGRWGGEPLHWESPSRRVPVGDRIAELMSVFALSEPYPRAGESITVEATLRGLVPSRGLILEFWVETPKGESISVDKTATEALGVGEVATYKADPFVPEQEGIYVIHAYLFDDGERIGHERDHLSIAV